MHFSAKKFGKMQKSEVMNFMPAIDHWLTWREKCALALCPAPMQTSLQAFVHARFRRYASSYSTAFNVGEPEVVSIDARDAWHCFETHFRLQTNRQGKSYKEWLFARAALKTTVVADDVESGVSLLLRDVVRDRLRHECSPGRLLSIDAMDCRINDGASVGLMELLPDGLDTNSEVESKEIESIASRLADSILSTLSFRERIAILGRELGLSLANPCVLKLAGCAKSALAKAHRSALTCVATMVSTAYPDESAATLATLTVAAFNVVRSLTVSWARAENSLSEFLTSIEPLVKLDGTPRQSGAATA